MDKLKRNGSSLIVKKLKQWEIKRHSLCGTSEIVPIKWVKKKNNNHNPNFLFFLANNRWFSFKKEQKENVDDTIATTTTEIGKLKQEQLKKKELEKVINISNVNIVNNVNNKDFEKVKEELEEFEKVKEDEEEEEEANEKYIKSFYEIYNDDKDTYDCPSELLRFIRKEHINVKINIKCSSPRNLQKKDVQEIIINMFKNSEVKNEEVKDEEKKIEKTMDVDDAKEINKENVFYLKSRFKEFSYPERNVIWPNPLIYNHRIQPFILKKRENETNEHFEREKKTLETNKHRLENLWSYSSSYGICWDWLDELFLNFKKKKTEHLNEWENNKNQIMLYASKVCKRKLIEYRKKLLDKLNIDYSNNIYMNYNENENIINLEEEDKTEYNLLLPRSVFRKWTRTLYYYWKDRYMHYYNNTLCDYLKGEIVDKQLLREHNERNLNMASKNMLEQHSYNLKKVKGSNLYVTRFVKRKKEKGNEKQKKNEEYEFDLTGVGQCIYDTEQRKN